MRLQGAEPNDLVHRARRQLLRRLLILLPVYVVVFLGMQLLLDRYRAPSRQATPRPTWLPILMIVIAVALVVATIAVARRRLSRPESVQVVLLAHRPQVKSILKSLRRGQDVPEHDRELASYVVTGLKTAERQLRWLLLVTLLTYAVMLITTGDSARVILAFSGLLFIAVLAVDWRQRSLALAAARRQGIAAAVPAPAPPR